MTYQKFDLGQLNKSYFNKVAGARILRNWEKSLAQGPH